jgi:hypothetical protein
MFIAKFWIIKNDCRQKSNFLTKIKNRAGHLAARTGGPDAAPPKPFSKNHELLCKKCKPALTLVGQPFKLLKID